MIARQALRSALRGASSASASSTSLLVKSLSSFSLAPSPSGVSTSSPLSSFSRRSFCSAVEDSSLSQILSEEIIEETNRREEEVDEDYQDIKKYISSVFTISEKVGYGEVQLSRTFNNEKITVKFDCQDEANDDAMGENGPSDEEMEGAHHQVSEEEAENIDDKIGIHFEVRVEKDNGTAVFNCIATHQQPSISHVSFLPKGTSENDEDIYGGPRFEDLDPAVQGAFQTYLAERGIDDDLSFFVITHSRYKEEAEYLNWLKSVNDFVN